MATYSDALRIQRLVLSGGVQTPISPPAPFRRVMVGNLTGGDVQVHSSDDAAQSEYRVIKDGFEREFRAFHRMFYRPLDRAFWLLSVGGGTVILEWS